jgi:hypothetical protein
MAKGPGVSATSRIIAQSQTNIHYYSGPAGRLQQNFHEDCPRRVIARAALKASQLRYLRADPERSSMGSVRDLCGILFWIFAGSSLDLRWIFAGSLPISLVTAPPFLPALAHHRHYPLDFPAAAPFSAPQAQYPRSSMARDRRQVAYFARFNDCKRACLML